ncbi:3'(2'),5'-bisphosphate nucleotidase CysQ [Roseimarinus sediminis]|uniref:3'(2'),5'-bisphosphate nucleotidase CysQ n=1 Tax=Roseimarinus sediminis TaxID=1610899 RepID=UPI003D225490
MNKHLKIAISAALKAGASILEIYNTSDFGVSLKADNSPLTLADKAAHEDIIQMLANTPWPVLSEEGKDIPWEERKNWERYWLVDPLDGTKEFIKRNGDFTVNIALIEHGNPLTGVIYIPVSGTLYFADDQGAFMVQPPFDASHPELKAIQLPCYEPGNEEYMVVGSRSHLNKETSDYLNQLQSHDRPIKIISRGSSLKFCMIAEGRAHCYPRMGPTMEWDTAAGDAICRHAGKKVTVYPGGTALQYNKEKLLNPWFVVS